MTERFPVDASEAIRFITAHSPPLSRYGNDVEKDCKKVESAAGKNKEVPHGVVVRQAAPAVEGEAQDVDGPAGNEEHQAGRREAGEQGFNGDDNEEAHPDVEADRGDRPTAEQGDLKYDAEQRDRPDDTENGPAPGAADIHQNEGGVSPGDQEKDGCTIEDAQDDFGLRELDAVIEGGGRVQQDERDSKDDAAHDMPGIAEQGSERGQDHKRPDRQDGADPVSDAVGQFFRRAVPRHG
jgi:hypothetical protein